MNLRKLNELLGLAGGIVIMIVSFLLCFEIISREFLSGPTRWTFPIAQYLILLFVFLGTSYSFQEGGHVNVELLIDKLGSSRRVLTIIGYAFAGIYTGVLLWYSFKSFLLAVEMDWITMGSLPIPTALLYAVMIIGSFILFLTIIQMILNQLFQTPHKNDIGV